MCGPPISVLEKRPSTPDGRDRHIRSMQPDWIGERVVGYANTMPSPKTKKITKINACGNQPLSSFWLS